MLPGPSAENVNNNASYVEAVNRQFGSAGDNLNADLWIEKN